MMKIWVGLTTSALLSIAMPARVAAQGPGTAILSKAADTAGKSARLIASADAALGKKDIGHAIGDAEAAVLLSPGDASARALLGRCYFAAGRFASAEAALRDALTLDPSLGRAMILRSFALIALGQGQAASESLRAAKGIAPEADIGLALAFLGDGDEARDRLLAASRAAGADVRVRQNLAFAYALEGRWNDAAAVAAQDVPADQMPARLRRWAMIAQLRGDPAMQVGALLGVLPSADAGQPAALALIAPVEKILVAETAIPLSLTVVDTPISLTATPLAIERPMSLLGMAARAEVGPPRMRSVSRVAEAPAKPMPIVKAQLVAFRPSAPRPIAPAAHRNAQRWAVQLGAYRSDRRPAAAWAQLSGKARYLTAYVPTGSATRWGNATLYRLSIGGFASRADATRLCVRLKANGGHCFVRTDQGEAPIRWTLGNRNSQPA